MDSQAYNAQTHKGQNRARGYTRRGNVAPPTTYFRSFFFGSPLFRSPAGAQVAKTLRRRPRRECGPVAPKRGSSNSARIICWREPKSPRASWEYIASDSQIRAKPPPGAEKRDSKRGNPDQHYGSEGKRNAETGARTEKRKPQEKMKNRGGGGGAAFKTNRTAIARTRTERAATQWGRPGSKRGAGAPLPSSAYCTESGAKSIYRVAGAASLAYCKRATHAIAQPRPDYPRRNLADGSPGSARRGMKCRL